MKYKARFSIRTSPNANGLHQIQIDASLNGVRLRYGTSVYVPRHAFLKSNQKCIAVPGFSRKKANEANSQLISLLEKSNAIFNAAQDRGQLLTKSVFIGYLDSTRFTDFITFAYDVVNKKLKLKEIQPQTAQTYLVAISHVAKMISPIIPFNQLAELPRKLEGQLKSANLNHNTRKKIHTRIQTICIEAERQNLPFDNPYANYTIGTIKGQRSALTEAELKHLFAIYRRQNLPPHLQNVLQYFLFSCLTGCRYSDVAELTNRNIKGDYLVFTPIKTKALGKEITMRLPLPAKELLTARTGKLFDVITDQKTNHNLKVIMQHAGICKHITFHSARHTFGTLFIHFGGDVSLLQQLMGHSKIETTSAYLHLAESIKAQSVTLFDDM